MSFKNLPKQANKEKKSELILSVHTLSEFDLWSFAPNRNMFYMHVIKFVMDKKPGNG